MPPSDDWTHRRLDDVTWAARAAILVLVAMLAFAGLWLLLSPTFGPPGSAADGSSIETARLGGRAQCPPPLLALFSDPEPADDGSKTMACMEVGRLRISYGMMLLLTAGVGAIGANVMESRALKRQDIPAAHSEPSGT